MAEESEDGSEKTEDPTRKRLEEAEKQGQFPHSREVTTLLFFAILLHFVISVLPNNTIENVNFLANFITNTPQLNLEEISFKGLVIDSFKQSFFIIAIPLLLTMIVSITSSLLQNGRFNFSTEAITPKFSKISPAAGLKRLFSSRSVVELLKGIVKITLLGIIAYLAIKPSLIYLKSLHSYELPAIVKFIWMLIRNILLAMCIAMIFVAVLDFAYQYHKYLEGLKMTKQEIKEEYKQTEGNPEIKAKLRSMRAEKARKRMMAAVPSADVIITNPTHYSIALKYDPDKMGAPICVAKGIDNIALTIREIAKKNEIPIVENKPLARALYDEVEIDEEIPINYYQAVAEIIKYVYNLKNKKFS